MEYDLDVLHSSSNGGGKKSKKQKSVLDEDLRTDRDLDAMHREGVQIIGTNRDKRKGRENARVRQFQKRAARELRCSATNHDASGAVSVCSRLPFWSDSLARGAAHR
jgi:hypothetical protein